ncbi:aminopeptidase [Polaribacter sp. BAL334]|uniref:aminopeptidase n=1 Tax=Polaribacter sp. BAL334 TaxID=1708178 RepID=UPI001E48B43A|nr:aminopeptidase [Polaribacter sp. BAL334]
MILCFLCSVISLAQNNSIAIKGIFNPEKDELQIQQEIVFHNQSDSIFTHIYLHNWGNSFSSRKTPLSKRLIKDFKKELYFAKPEEIGFTTIKNLTVDFENVVFNEVPKQADIIDIQLNTPLKPSEKRIITITYSLKIPDAKFTNYGKTKTGYHLRFWYMTPAIFQNEWKLMSNLNTDDLFENTTDFTIEIQVPKPYVLESNLYQYETKNEHKTDYYLVGKNKTNVILSFNKTAQLKTYQVNDVAIYTDVLNDKIEDTKCVDILSRELLFIEKYLGKYPHKEIYIDKITQDKNPIVGLSQLPSFIRPFSEEFKWDITLFKALSIAYLENRMFLNLREEYWLMDGIQNYLIIEYIETYYPEMKLLGKISEKWYLKNFNISKLKFNEKYPLIYQFVSRQFLDQALDTPVDSLSNFNRKIANKYKAGLAIKYLKNYLGDSILNSSIKELYQEKSTKLISTADFKEIITKKTTKNLDWFFEDFIKTNKKIDYTIDDVFVEKDSLKVTIRNKRNITTPVLLYGLNDKEIIFKKWFTNIDDTTTVNIPNQNINKVALNYENTYPELNTLDNWKSLEKKIFNKPLKFNLIKDIDDPYYNQLFYQPNISYNFYNGIILGVRLHNKPLIKRNLEASIAPAYATNSGTVIGQFSVLLNQYFEETSIYRIRYGIAGLTLDYAPNLSYKSLMPFVNMEFKRKDLRDATSEILSARMVHIDKEVSPNTIKTDQDNYNVLSINYSFINPDIIKEFRYNFSAEIAQNFSKIAADIRFRSLTTSDTQLDFRLFVGTFLSNKTTGDYFSFGLDRANDYLFQLNYFGRSEDSGIFSQQFIIAEGGFKSVLPTRFANQFMASFNSSFGLWKWVEFYNDVAFLKSRNSPVYFAYNNGIRLNFVHQILEVYFPLYSNNGWEISQGNYQEKIRFTFTADLNAIFNFIRRGIL